MGDRLHVGVMGAGAIGCYVGGRLLASNAADVTFVGRERTRDVVRASGITTRDFGGDGDSVPAGRVVYELDASALATCDAVLCCVKSAHTGDAAESMATVLGPVAVVASLQNGVHNAERLRERLGDRPVLAGIVDFNVVPAGDGVFQRTTSGPLTLERPSTAAGERLVAALRAANVEVKLRDDIAPDQWTKLLVNLNNSISALSGAPTRELILAPGYRRIVSSVIAEGHRVLRASGIRPARLRGVPVGVMTKMMRMPTFVVKLLASAQMKIDPDARSSMHEDLRRGRPTEVDDLNGEIVAMAERNGIDAPLNRRIVELVRDAERAGAGSPGLSADALWFALVDTAGPTA